MLRARGDLDGAAAADTQGDRACTRSGAMRHLELGLILLTQGHAQGGAGKLHDREAARCREPTPSHRSTRTSPSDCWRTIGFPRRLRRRGWRSRNTHPRAAAVAEYPWLVLIAAESANGQDAEARADLQKFLATPRTWRTMAEIQKFPYFAANPKLLEGLRRAGMPAE